MEQPKAANRGAFHNGSRVHGPFGSIPGRVVVARFLRVWSEAADNQPLRKCLVEKEIGYSPRSKHIDVRHHFVREQLENHIIQLQHVSSDCQRADALTKPIAGKMKEASESPPELLLNYLDNLEVPPWWVKNWHCFRLIANGFQNFLKGSYTVNSKYLLMGIIPPFSNLSSHKSVK